MNLPVLLSFEWLILTGGKCFLFRILFEADTIENAG